MLKYHKYIIVIEGVIKIRSEIIPKARVLRIQTPVGQPAKVCSPWKMIQSCGSDCIKGYY